jgi:hypothetical protein
VGLQESAAAASQQVALLSRSWEYEYACPDPYLSFPPLLSQNSDLQATFRNILNPMNSTTFVLFNKYYSIVDQLGSKDSSNDFQLNCVLSYFLATFTTSCIGPKIDVMERVKKF